MARQGSQRQSQYRRPKPDDYHYRVFNCPNWALEQRMKVIDQLDSELSAQMQMADRKRQERDLRLEILNLKIKIADQSTVLFKKYFNTFQRSWDVSTKSYNRHSEEMINKGKEIRTLEAQQVLLGKVRTVMEKRLARVQLVKEFMTAVCVESKDEFKSVDDVIQRFDFLFKTRQGQVERIAELNSKLENLQSHLQDSTIEDDSELLSLQLKVLNMGTRRDNLETKLQTLHETLLERKASLVSEMVRIPILESAITDLYNRICNKLNETPDPTLPISNQMDYIQVAFKQISGMRKTARHLIGPVSNVATGKHSVKTSSRKK